MTMTRSKRERRNQRLRRELAAKDLKIGDLTAQNVDLTEQIVKLSEKVQLLSDEIKRLKKLPKHPKLKPNKGTGMHDKVKAKLSNSTDGKRKKRRRGRKKYSDNIQRKTIDVKAKNVPEGSTRIGFKNYRVQELVLSPLLIEYRREIWRMPCGRRITADLPEHVKGSHYGSELRCLVVSLYYQGQSTVPSIVDGTRFHRDPIHF